MLHLLKDLQEYCIPSEINQEGNRYTFIVTNIGEVTIADSGGIVEVIIDGMSSTHTPIEAFNFIAEMSEKKRNDDYVINEIKEESIFYN